MAIKRSRRQVVMSPAEIAALYAGQTAAPSPIPTGRDARRTALNALTIFAVERIYRRLTGDDSRRVGGEAMIDAILDITHPIRAVVYQEAKDFDLTALLWGDVA